VPRLQPAPTKIRLIGEQAAPAFPLPPSDCLPEENSRKQRISGGAVLTGGNNRSGKVLLEIMIIGILNKIAVRKGL
jgi:hypothetical protein